MNLKSKHQEFLCQFKWSTIIQLLNIGVLFYVSWSCKKCISICLGFVFWHVWVWFHVHVGRQQLYSSLFVYFLKNIHIALKYIHKQQQHTVCQCQLANWHRLCFILELRRKCLAEVCGWRNQVNIEDHSHLHSLPQHNWDRSVSANTQHSIKA